MATTASIQAPAGQRTRIELSLALAVAVAAAVADLGGLALGLDATRTVGTLAVTPIGTLGAFVFVLTLVAVGLILRARRPDHRLRRVFLWFWAGGGVFYLALGGGVEGPPPGGGAAASGGVFLEPG